MKKRGLVVLLAAVLLLQACSNKDFKPRGIVSETDVCKVCNMSIVHEEYAGQIALSNGDYEMFDDLGCLIEYMKNLNKGDVGKAFIKDEGEKNWVDVKTASYVYDKDIWTPMSYGVIAFESKDSAQQYIDKVGKGQLLSYSDLDSFKWGVHH
ncbi:nitrous oxide reductase accessory protein NosL [Viridibacillus sp. FSL R5-0477]|uniref:Lipoprotein n=1 Tax=Viridibacillus arenosi FSL R5-213 TaxID=1227360 RepID=W4ENQ3_9BACL|nr:MULTISPECIES: nitrous oxide reductase accessory protein NosL [Viridibacillus]ETT82200.1 lipoprotein [Viridibacillus arenosi FSL R5-213]OMC83718.1 hypothetical protein BK128_18625 [Viridibacillus sp. FSL H7-0596]OMC85209.1 hypothetical protein BK130_00080 [Viridibacillus sp. FSL H8-0123]OMC92687.1 hypothetical protein BK137_06535 [Viridibacillus arenosi]